MRANARAEFKRWQTLPLLTPTPREGDEAARLPKCRAAESAGPSCAKSERVCRSRSAEVEASRPQPEDTSMQAAHKPGSAGTPAGAIPALQPAGKGAGAPTQQRGFPRP